MTEYNQPDLTKSVMAEIKAKHVCIQPKAVLLLGSVAVGVGLALLVGLAVLITSLVFYYFRHFGLLSFLWFGRYGLNPFFHTIPWLWIAASLICITLGYILLKRYDFSYKTGYRVILLVFCLSILGMAGIIDQIGLHESISRQPMMQSVYVTTYRGSNWMMGEVMIASPSSVTIVTPEHQQYVIHYSSKTWLPFGADFQPGDWIRMVGSFDDDHDFTVRGIGN